MICPKCNSTDVETERRIGGYNICRQCTYYWPRTDTPDEKPREWKFKIYQQPTGYDVIWDGNFNKCMSEGSYHVIEHFAYATVVRERDELRAEVERLHAKYDFQYLVKQNARLREALELIAKGSWLGESLDAQQIARAALEGKC